jgi:hypothetical protein
MTFAADDASVSAVHKQSCRDFHTNAAACMAIVVQGDASLAALALCTQLHSCLKLAAYVLQVFAGEGGAA